CRICRTRTAPVRRCARPAGCLAGDVEAAADFAHASVWRLLVLLSLPWFPVRPASLRDPRWQARAARPAACRVQKIARTARAVPWPASASAVRFPAGRRHLARRDRPKMLDYTEESLNEIALAIEREVPIAFHFPI